MHHFCPNLSYVYFRYMDDPLTGEGKFYSLITLNERYKVGNSIAATISCLLRSHENSILGKK